MPAPQYPMNLNPEPSDRKSPPCCVWRQDGLFCFVRCGWVEKREAMRNVRLQALATTVRRSEQRNPLLRSSSTADLACLPSCFFDAIELADLGRTKACPAASLVTKSTIRSQRSSGPSPVFSRKVVFCVRRVSARKPMRAPRGVDRGAVADGRPGGRAWQHREHGRSTATLFMIDTYRDAFPPFC